MVTRKGREFIFWIDLECTGSDDDEEIVEIGAIITDRELNELAHKSYVIPPTQEKLEGMKQVVVDMHTKSGLMEVLDNPIIAEAREKALKGIDLEFAEWVRSFVGNDHIVFAGSGVAHYDRKYIKRDLPLLNDRLTYFALDVGAIRRGIEYAGVKWSEDFYEKTHRALDDARQACDEFRRFVNWCKDAVQNGNDFQL